MPDITLEDALIVVRAHGYRVVEAEPEPEPNRCWTCGVSEHDEYLTDVRVIVAEGEEGHADLLRWFCDRDLENVTLALVGDGWCDHRHGGINFLEDTSCPGARDSSQCVAPVTDEDED